MATSYFTPLFAIVTALLSFGTPVRAAIPPTVPPSPAVMVLDDHNITGSDPLDIYCQEVFRQALVIAARDEMGLDVRDVGTGDSAGTKGIPGAKLLNLRGTCPPNTDIYSLNLSQRVDGKTKTIWTLPINYGVTQGWGIDPFMTTKAAALIKLFPNVLKSAGFKSSFPAGRETKVPATASRKFWDMNFIAQWAALRQVDADVQRGGTSFRALQLLARGNANMGMLTDQLLTAYRDAYKARAMLYAAMLRQKYPHNPATYWTQAYVDTLVGLPRVAKKEIRIAIRLAPAAPKPAWAKTIEAYLALNTLRLARIARGQSSQAGLAAVLAAMSLEYTVDGDYHLQRQIAIEAFTKPLTQDCMCLIEILENRMNVSSGHILSERADRMLGYTLSYRLDSLADVPPAVRRELRPVSAEGNYSPAHLEKLIRAMAATDAPPMKSGFPSWQSLAAITQATAVFNCENALYFLRFGWAVGLPQVNGYLMHIRPLAAHDPWWPLLEIYGVPNGTAEGRSRIIALMRSLHVFYPTVAALNSVWMMQGIEYPWKLGPQVSGPVAMVPLYTKLLLECYNDQADLCDEFSQQLYDAPDRWPVWLQSVLKLNPLSPCAIEYSLAIDPALVKQYMPRWKAASLHSIAVLTALGQGLYEYGKSPGAKLRAMPYLQRMAKQAPCHFVFAHLAVLYKQQGNVRQYVIMQKKAIAATHDGVAAAYQQTSLAQYLMRRGHFHQAEHLLKPAAQTWASFPMWEAARCYSAMGKWAEAEKWIRRDSQRYPDSSEYDWYFWCAMEQHGDIIAAREFAIANLNALDANNQFAAGTVAQLIGRPHQALKAYAIAADHDSNTRGFDLLSGAMVAQYLHKHSVRDRMLAAAAADKFGANQPYAALATLFQQALLPGHKLNLVAVNNLEHCDKRIWWPHLFYFVGRFLQLRGDKSDAEQYFRRGARHYNFLSATQVLCVAALHKMGIGIDPNGANPKGKLKD